MSSTKTLTLDGNGAWRDSAGNVYGPISESAKPKAKEREIKEIQESEGRTKLAQAFKELYLREGKTLAEAEKLARLAAEARPGL